MENEFDFFNTLSGSDFDKTKLGNYGTFDDATDVPYRYVPLPVNKQSNIQSIDTTPPEGIKTINQPYQSNNGGSFSLPIDYDNLIIPFSESEQKNNMFTNAIDKFKSFKDKNKALSGILKAGSFIKDPAMAIFSSVMGMLPEQDPRATAARNFYGDNFGLTSSGSVDSGIMQGYNPVSGGLLNMITGGRMGEETQYGLGPAIDRRIAKINQSLNKYDKYKYGSKAFDPIKYNQQIKKLEKLEKLRAAELAAQQEAKEQTARELRNAQEAAFAAAGGNRAAQDRQRRADAATVAQANRDYSSGASYSGGESTRGDDTSYNDPFDPGGGEKDGGHIDGTNRRRYGKGGIVSL